MFPYVPAWCPPLPVGVPVPLPTVNVLGVKVTANDLTSMVNVGPASILHPSSAEKSVRVNNVTGDWGNSVVWWGMIYDADATGAAAWNPQGYL